MASIQLINYGQMLRRTLDEAKFDESKHKRDSDGKFSSTGGSGGIPADDIVSQFFAESDEDDPGVDVTELKKVGEQLGSNEGGVFEHPDTGDKFYVKKGKSKDHVKNEMLAGALYNLAGSNTLRYQKSGGDHIVTNWETPDKKNVSQFTPEERKKAQEDFAVHAWLGNWDAVGTGGDNQAIIDGKPTSVDLGGALLYRAQGAPKGDAFGSNVSELATMRDSSKNKDAAALFSSMSNDQIKESIDKVTKISDADIKQMVAASGMPTSLADKLIARKLYMKQYANDLDTGQVSTPMQQSEAVKAIANTKVYGGSAERVKMRAAIKNATDKDVRAALQAKVIESFEIDIAKAQKAGKTEKVADLTDKKNKYAAMYGVSKPKTMAQANAGYSPEVQKQAKAIVDQQVPKSKQTPELVEGYNDLVSIVGNTAKSLLASSEVIIKKQGLDMTPVELSHVRAYTGSAYRQTNAALRLGSMSEQRWKHVNAMNKALSKMPNHVGTVYRKADLPKDVIKLYEVGNIVEERAFTSTSKNKGVWSGDYHYEIISKTGKDVSGVSVQGEHSKEAEVLFRSGTRFKVLEVTGNKIKMEEIDGR